ncbi:MAG: alpha/beta fold hydrolase [Nitrococcus mobilis]|nr:alpha/beta fold hydrolase [Nitrococcus mobilis]
MPPEHQRVRLHYQTSGAGPALLLLHGLFGSGSNWKRHARELAERYRVLRPDLRNHGRTPHVPSMDYRVMAEDVIGLLDAEALDKVALVGHSMGGKVAMALALTHPERITALVAVDIAPVAYGRHLRGYVEAMRRLRLAEIGSRAEADQALASAVTEPMIRQFLLTNLERHAGQYQWRIPLDILADQMPLLEGFPEPKTTFSGPSLFIYGGRSQYVTKARHGIIRQVFPHAEFACIPEVGHWLHVEAPEQFAELLKSFLVRTQFAA